MSAAVRSAPLAWRLTPVRNATFDPELRLYKPGATDFVPMESFFYTMDDIATFLKVGCRGGGGRADRRQKHVAVKDSRSWVKAGYNTEMHIHDEM